MSNTSSILYNNSTSAAQSNKNLLYYSSQTLISKCEADQRRDFSIAKKAETVVESGVVDDVSDRTRMNEKARDTCLYRRGRLARTMSAMIGWIEQARVRQLSHYYFIVASRTSLQMEIADCFGLNNTGHEDTVCTSHLWYAFALNSSRSLFH